MIRQLAILNPPVLPAKTFQIPCVPLHPELTIILNLVFILTQTFYGT